MVVYPAYIVFVKIFSHIFVVDTERSLLRQIQWQRYIENATLFDDEESWIESGGNALQA